MTSPTTTATNAMRLPRIQRSPSHPLMSVNEAAAVLGISDMTIRRRIAAKQFPAIQIGRRAMVPRSFIEGLMAAAESGATVVVEEAVTEWNRVAP